VSEEQREQWEEEKRDVVRTFYQPKALFRQVDLFSDNPVDFERRIGRCGGLSSAAFEFRSP
jgi:hypothetical protein